MLPTGIVTFLFTDIEGSTRLWDQDPEATRIAMVRHDAIVEGGVERHGGTIVRPRGEGDSRFAVFLNANDAVLAAAAIQQDIAAEPWTTPRPLRVRMALHTGEADLRMSVYLNCSRSSPAALSSRSKKWRPGSSAWMKLGSTFSTA